MPVQVTSHTGWGRCGGGYKDFWGKYFGKDKELEGLEVKTGPEVCVVQPSICIETPKQLCQIIHKTSKYFGLICSIS